MRVLLADRQPGLRALLDLIAEGMGNSAIFGKLQVTDRAQAIARVRGEAHRRESRY
jgi:hypothetical protein